MSFFDKNTNPFMKMFELMSQEEQDRYKKMGDYMYGIVDFETGELTETEKDREFKNILDALRSGLSINDLNEHERGLVEQYWGSLDNVLANGN